MFWASVLDWLSPVFLVPTRSQVDGTVSDSMKAVPSCPASCHPVRGPCFCAPTLLILQDTEVGPASKLPIPDELYDKCHSAGQKEAGACGSGRERFGFDASGRELGGCEPSRHGGHAARQDLGPFRRRHGRVGQDAAPS